MTYKNRCCVKCPRGRKVILLPSPYGRLWTTQERRASGIDNAYREFYNSSKWRQISKQIMDRFDGLDVYGCMLLDERYHRKADIVHHIVALEDDPYLAFSEANLIPVSFETHLMIHQEYEKNESAKYWMQCMLRNALSVFFTYNHQDSEHKDKYPEVDMGLPV